ncbi:MFS transporter [Salmonella enterica subsp. enterica serovar Enteritidis]|nr:MFS transporter [Salmonella enterica subsp. enterica serovar Enteritidis]
MTRYTTTDVLICGAGVTGLTLAIELARHGVSFRLIEKRTTPFIGSRGKGIQPRTQEIFEDLGILNKVVAAGGLYPRLRTYRHDGSYVDSDIAHHTKPTHAEPYHLPLMVPQNVTETIMREQLKAWGHRVEFGCELRHFAQTPRTVTAYVAGPAGEEVIIAHYLIGADGGGSFVRKKLGVSFPGRTLGIHALVADASLSGLNRDVWHHFNDGDMTRMITICPLAGTQLFQIQALLAPDDSQNFSADVLTAFLTERIGRTDVRIHSIPWVSKYQMNARIAEHYRVGKVFLAGDAAHVHPPTGGQGLNTSIQDAYNLGWKMAASLRGAGEELLDSYEQERRPVAESLLHLSTRLLDSQKQGGIKRELFAYGMYSSQLPVFLSDTFIWNGLPFGPKALSYLLMADGVINIFVQLFLLGWVSQYFSERKLIILIFALLCTGFLTAGIATTIPVLVFAIVCISIADALAKPTYLAALSVHVSPARQGIVIGTAQALIAIADFISPVLGGFVLGYALYGVWIGIAISVAIIGLVTAMIYLSKSSVLIVKPETE